MNTIAFLIWFTYCAYSTWILLDEYVNRLENPDEDACRALTCDMTRREITLVVLLLYGGFVFFVLGV